MVEYDEERRLWFRRKVLPLEPCLLRYAARFSTSTSDDAEDFVHETFARLIAYARWREIENVQAFAVSTLHNIAVQAMRRLKIVPIHAFNASEMYQIIDSEPGADRVLESRDELRLLANLIEGLPPKCRHVFELRKIYGLSHAEIAESLGLSVSTVEKHVIKGLRLCSEGLATSGAKAATRDRNEFRGEEQAKADQGRSGRLGGSAF